jgi:hypothetical protein
MFDLLMPVGQKQKSEKLKVTTHFALGSTLAQFTL